MTTNWLASEASYMETLKKNMTVNPVSPENRAKFVEKVKPVWDAYVKGRHVYRGGNPGGPGGWKVSHGDAGGGYNRRRLFRQEHRGSGMNDSSTAPGMPPGKAHRIEEIVAGVLERLLTIVFMGIFALVVVLVVLRYVFNTTIVGGNEATVMLFIYTTALGSAVKWRAADTSSSIPL